MRDSAQVTAPGAIASMIVAVSTKPNRQNRSTCSRNNARINDLDGRTTKALNGVSMAFAMGGTPWLLPTERFAVSMDWGTFQGTNALALTAAVRLGTNVQANGGLAYGANGGGAGGRAGVRVGW